MKDLAIFADVRDHLIRHGLADDADDVTLSDDDVRVMFRRTEHRLALFVEAASSVRAAAFTAIPSQYLHLEASGVLDSGRAVRVKTLLYKAESDLVVANVPLSVEVPVDQLLPLISAEVAEDRPTEAVSQ